MAKALTSALLARALLKHLHSTDPLRGLNSHVALTDPEAIDTHVGEDCILRVRAQRVGTTAQRAYSASLELAYPSTEPDRRELWSAAPAPDSDRYFPLGCNLSELSALPPIGLPATDGAVELLAQMVTSAIREHVWPVRTRAAARAELERGPSSVWYSLLAAENWLPVVLLLDEGPRAAAAFARGVLAQQPEGESIRTLAYREFVSNLERRVADA